MWWPFSRKYPERSPEDVNEREYDYIVVGGGTAGCALASRLSENPDISVLLLERGIANDTWISRIPIVSSNILKSDGGTSSWNCEPMKHCNNRRSLFYCGEVMGGSSRINSMLYTRGAAADFDAWAALGHPEWSYEKVLPFFIKGEKTLNQPKLNYRGDSGPWLTRTYAYSTWFFKAYRVFADCALAMGFASVSDLNSPSAPADSIATLDSTVNEVNQRVSTFHAFLSREIALKREKHLTICTNAIVSRIVFSEKEETPRAQEVIFTCANQSIKKTFSARVKKEVIVCAGSIGSPQVLMLSGIGPGEHLEEHGIDVVRDLPGVGSELTDHHAIPVAWEVPLKESFAKIASAPVIRGGLEFLKYIFFRSGLLSMPIQVLSLFVRSASLRNNGTELVAEATEKSTTNDEASKNLSPEKSIPDIELIPIAFSGMDDLEEYLRLYSKMGIFTILATLLQPKSRGTVRLASSNPHDRPKIDFGILSDPSDYAVARASVRLSLKLGEEMKAAGFPFLRNIAFPEDKQEKDIKEGSTEELDKLIRRRIRTIYHYSSSCRMAPADDPNAPGVVDDELRVHGVNGLRVCDTSVFPQITSAHLQAPAVMVAERCADFILKGLKTNEG